MEDIKKINFDSISEDTFWNTSDKRDLKMHHIHAYPAKFPAFITDKALEYAKNNSIKTESIADVFCGCGTVAFEARRNNINFWGCDINPVATMIAKVKSQSYDLGKLEKYYELICETFLNDNTNNITYENANERIKYWYDEKHYIDLFKLKRAINLNIPFNSKYYLFFMCAFSNILKSTSRWLTKSIKPQIDPNKKPVDVMRAFIQQYYFMKEANSEINVKGLKSSSRIVTTNFLNNRTRRPKVDIIITSPPYVTSYEYADLHQLSSLWLDYATDYRDLRVGSIGSLHHDYNFNRELKKINSIGSDVVFRLIDRDRVKAKSVAKYFLDMQLTAKRCYEMLNDNGMAFFVIGNTEYKGIRIENAQHLTESLLNSGFERVLVTKRRISRKILTPYRDEKGKFTTDKNSRKVYSEEFILIGRK